MFAGAREIARVGSHPLKNNSTWQAGEVQFIINNEKPVHVEDVLLRRSTLAWLGEVNKGLVEEIAAIFADSFKWSEKEKNEEIEHTIDHLKEYHGIQL